jgi:hypothetical protein
VAERHQRRRRVGRSAFLKLAPFGALEEQA